MGYVDITLPIKSIYHEGGEVDLELREDTFRKGKAQYKITLTISLEDYAKLSQPGRRDQLKIRVSTPKQRKKTKST